MSPHPFTRIAVIAAAACALAAPAAALADAPEPPSGDAGPASGTAKAAPETAAPAPEVVPGRFIVKVKRGSNPDVLAKEHGAKAKFVFTSTFNGFSAQLSDKQLEHLRHDRKVEGVEPVTVQEAESVQTYDVPWGLDRIDQRSRPLNGAFTFGYSGAGVNAYVIDSGIQTSHPQFGGRAVAAYDNVGDGRAGQDCHGHGTHVAGTIGGATYGVAKSVRLYSVRTLNCLGKTTSDAEMAAVNWVRLNARHPAVANISIGGPRNSYLNQAVTNLANSGVFVSVAAGNDNIDACNVSPASAPGTFTAAASDGADVKASFSNWGACVDGYAPGVGVKSSYPTSTTNVMNGTSMASPHVAGIVAVGKSAYGDGYATSTWVNWVISNATTNVIYNNVGATPNRLVFKGTL